MACATIMGVLLDKRSQTATNVQDVLTRHGCLIHARFGLHEAGDRCSEQGLIILNLCGTKDEITALEADLRKVPGVRCNKMEL